MRVLTLILLMATVAPVVISQQRNTTVITPLPAPGSPVTVTLSLAEYNLLV